MPTFNFQEFSTWQEALAASFNRAFGQIISLLPNVVAMLAVIVVGYIVARVLDRFAAALSQSLGLETAAERSGLMASMKQVGIQRSVPSIVGQIVFWLTMCVFLSAAFNLLGLQAVSAAMEKIVAYIPNLLVATIVVVVGLLVAGLLRGVVATSADRVGISYAENLANGVYYVLALMTFIGAFDQLHIEFGLLKELILIACGGLALGFGLCPRIGRPRRDGWHSGRLLHPAAVALRRSGFRGRHGRDGPRGRSGCNRDRDGRRRLAESPQRAQYADAERSGAINLRRGPRSDRWRAVRVRERLRCAAEPRRRGAVPAAASPRPAPERKRNLAVNGPPRGASFSYGSARRQRSSRLLAV